MDLDFSKLQGIPSARATAADDFPDDLPAIDPDRLQAQKEPAPNDRPEPFTIVPVADLESSRQLQRDILGGILSGDPPEMLFLKAIEALALATGDREYTDQIRDDWTMLYGGEQPAIPDEWRLEEVQKDIKKLRASIRKKEKALEEMTKPLGEALRKLENLEASLSSAVFAAGINE